MILDSCSLMFSNGDNAYPHFQKKLDQYNQLMFGGENCQESSRNLASRVMILLNIKNMVLAPPTSKTSEKYILRIY